MKRRAGRGALVILALFLASSGALRIGVDVGAAMANSTDALVETPKLQSCPEPPAALAKALQTRESEVRTQEAVSYTHLDVYKRQPQRRSVLTQNQSLPHHPGSSPAPRRQSDGAAPWPGPVSYTHLDVYKRQTWVRAS